MKVVGRDFVLGGSFLFGMANRCSLVRWLAKGEG